MKKEIDSELAVLLVDTLKKCNALEEVIYGNGIECLRVCGHCGNLMNEGWMYDGRETYCCDECLLAAHPYENIANLNAHASDNDSETYWTTWE